MAVGGPWGPCGTSDATKRSARPSPRPGAMVRRRNWRELTARSLPTATQRAGTRLASRQRHDSEWTVTARGLRAIPIGLGREGRREPTVRVAKLRGGLPRLPSDSHGAAARLGVPPASCRTLPSAWADGTMPASGTRHVRCRLPSPIRPSKQPVRIHSSRCAS